MTTNILRLGYITQCRTVSSFWLCMIHENVAKKEATCKVESMNSTFAKKVLAKMLITDVNFAPISSSAEFFLQCPRKMATSHIHFHDELPFAFKDCFHISTVTNETSAKRTPFFARQKKNGAKVRNVPWSNADLLKIKPELCKTVPLFTTIRFLEPLNPEIPPWQLPVFRPLTPFQYAHVRRSAVQMTRIGLEKFTVWPGSRLAFTPRRGVLHKRLGVCRVIAFKRLFSFPNSKDLFCQS